MGHFHRAIIKRWVSLCSPESSLLLHFWLYNSKVQAPLGTGRLGRFDRSHNWRVNDIDSNPTKDDVLTRETRGRCSELCVSFTPFCHDGMDCLVSHCDEVAVRFWLRCSVRSKY